MTSSAAMEDGRNPGQREASSNGSLEQFNLSQPDEWEDYAQRFEFFLEAQGITDAGKKRSTFLSRCGAATFQLAKALVAPDQLKDTPYEDIIAALRNHLSPKPPELARRYEFHRREQGTGESVAAYLAALRTTAQHCNFVDLDKALRDRFVFGLRNDKAKRRILAKKEVSLACAVEEATAAEAIDREASQSRLNATAPRTEPVHQGTVADCGEDQDGLEECVRQLRADTSQRRDAGLGGGSCAGCGGPHERRLCRFRDAQCRGCGKTGHIAKVCRSQRKRDRRANFETNGRTDNSRTTPRASTSYCDNLTKTAIHDVPQPGTKKIHVAVEIEGVECEMEVDSGSTFSLISEATARQIFSNGCIPKLKQLDLVMKDYQGNCIAVQGMATVTVKFRGFAGPLKLVIVKGQRQSLLGLDWFPELGIKVTGVHRMDELATAFDKLFEEFAVVFDGRLGCYKGPPVKLALNPEVVPVRLKARRVPFALRQKIDAELDKLLQQGVLEPVDCTEWETPIVTPLKGNGDIRICADYKCTINKALQQHAYPVPVVSHVLASLSGGTIFAKLNLAQAYQQLPVTDESAAAQTIVTHRGAFRVRRLQFGVSVAPGIFQNLMETLLRGIPGVIPYFDDVLIAGASGQELLSRLREVLRRFQDAGLKVKREKCQLGVAQVEFLGFRIDAEGIHPTPEKTQAILGAPRPSNKTELQAFLGLVNFYHAFLPHKATVAEPLHRLLDKKATFVWGQTQQRAFESVKELLASNHVLTHYDEKQPLILACDASPYGIGAVLSHRLPGGTEAPVAFYSRTLSSAERNYAQIDKEALAVVAGVKKFHDYLFGRPFQIQTDHKPLLGLFTSDRQTPQMLSLRMLRWSIFLNGYQHTLLHRAGRHLGHADGLSRLPLQHQCHDDPSPAEVVMLLDALPEPPLHAADIPTHCAKDRTLSRVLNWVWKGWPRGSMGPEFSAFTSRQHELTAHKGCLLWSDRVVIPQKLRFRVLEALHSGHPGIIRMKALARSYVWWPGMDAAIEEWVRCCSSCQETRPELPRAPVHPWEASRNPWSRLHMDFAGPFQGQTFLIVVDSYSKWLEVIPTSSMTSQTVISALRKLFATHGLPDIIVSDNGAQFKSTEFREFLDSNLIRQVTSAPFHPSTNGQAERMVRTTKEGLSRIIQKNWARRLADFTLQQHVTPHMTTGQSLAELLMGRKLSTMLDRLHPDRAPEKSTRLADSPSKPRTFKPEDPVFARNYAQGPLWIPAVISRATGPISYEVTAPDGRVLRRHVDQLRRRTVGPTQTAGAELERPQPERRPMSTSTPEGSSSVPVAPEGSSSAPVEPDAPGEQPTPVISSVPPQEGGTVPLTVPVEANGEPLVPPLCLRRSQRARGTPHHLRDYVLALADC
nr:uncharacterized protein K02A2.6-like [Rhipicephalus microplus]